jgi:hypothetical protein
MLRENPNRTDAVLQLLATAPTETAFIPVSKLKRRDVASAGKKMLTSLSQSNLNASQHDELSLNSFGSDLSFGSIGENSLRERIRKIEEKIKEDNEHGQLDSHPTILTLPAEICSWNRRIPKKYRGISRPPVNIIGCHQPADLIVARADERIRKQIQAKDQKEKHMDQLVQYIDHLIHMKLTRSERYAALLEQQQRQSGWLRIVELLNFTTVLLPLLQHARQQTTQQVSRNDAAAKVQSVMSTWYERKVALRYSTFISHISKSVWKFRMQCVIYQKRRACRVIAMFLTDKKDNREV